MKTIDIREVASKERHALIFQEFNNLEAGDSFILRTDHDPKPLFYQFEAEKNGLFLWTSQVEGPDYWEIKLTRTKSLMTVAEVVLKHPSSMELFNRLGIDYCCHGDRPFEQAAKEAGHSSQELLQQIRKVPPPAERLNFAYWSMTMLCDFIVMNHHSYIRETLPEIKELSKKVLKAHGEKHPFLHNLKDKIEILDTELTEHLQKEEEQLFPAIRQAEAHDDWHEKGTQSLQDVLTEEHEEAGNLMKEIRQMTHDYQLPPEACISFHRLYDLLAEFERDLYVHVHLENNILFNKMENRQHANA